MIFRFDHPELLWLLLLALPIVWLGRRSLGVLDPARRWAAISLRLAVLLIVTLMLAGLQAVQRHTDLTVIAVVDQSESVRRFAQPPDGAQQQTPTGENANVDIEQWVQAFLRKAAADQRSDDRFALVTYDGRTTVRAMPGPGLTLDAGTVEQPVEGTDTASAIRTAMALLPPDSGARLVLVSDGNDTGSGSTSAGFAGDDADVLAAAREAAAAGVAIDVLPLAYQTKNEVLVEGVFAPTEAREGQTVALRVVLRATEPARGELQILHDDQPVDLNSPEAPGTGTPIVETDWTQEAGSDDAAGRFVAVKQVDLPIGYSGANRFEAVFNPAQGVDAMAVNNRAETFTLVTGKGKLLFVDNVGGDSGMILPHALQQRGIELDVVPPRSIPTRLSELQRYDAVVLQNVPADLVTGPQQRMLAKYVNDLGGGLVMLGGPESFGAGGWTNSPIDRILPVTCQIPSQTVLPSGALVLVIDRSGSMASGVAGTNQSQQVLANEAAVLALNTLYPQDLVGVVAFDSSAQKIVPVKPNSDPAAVAQLVRSIQPSGGTNIYSGLELAYDQLSRLKVQDAAIKHIVLLTDGNSTPPPGSLGYMGLVGKMVKSGISLSTIGVGDGHDAQLLDQLARMGDGRYHPISNPGNLPQIFIKEAKTIRKNLIKEVPFTPGLRNTGSPILASVSTVPELKGLVLTGEKKDPRVFMPMVGPEGEPVFAHWQVGLGRVAAFTSDATNRWATDWLSWGGYSDFWARTMRAIARPARSRDVDLVTAIKGQTLEVRLDAVASDDEGTGQATGFANFLQVRGSVLKPDGSTEPITLDQTGPGVYQASAPAATTGNYLVSLFVEDQQGDRKAVFSGANRPPGAELRRFNSNLPLLQEVAQITGGRWLNPAAAKPAGLFSRDQEFESRSIRPLWRTLIWWLVAVFLLDVACRRVAWDAVAIWNWVKARAAAIGGSMKPREVQAEATLAALKNRRTATDEKLKQAAAPADTAAPPAPASTRKFEAQGPAKPAADFTAAVGGASKEKLNTHQAANPSGNEDAGPTTSRLLAAKRRARQQAEEEE